MKLVLFIGYIPHYYILDQEFKLFENYMFVQSFWQCTVLPSLWRNGKGVRSTLIESIMSSLITAHTEAEAEDLASKLSVGRSSCETLWGQLILWTKQ